MHGIDYTPLVEGVFSTEKLDQNFGAIAEYSARVGETLDDLVNFAKDTNARLETLEHIKVVVKTPTIGKLVLLGAVGGAFYVGYKVRQFESRGAEMRRRGQMKPSSIGREGLSRTEVNIPRPSTDTEN